MILAVSDKVYRRAPRRGKHPLLVCHANHGWTLYYRDQAGRAARFVTGATTEAVARQRCIDWLATVKREAPNVFCEWDTYCPNTAAVLSKACGDDRHYAVCPEHLVELRLWFADQVGVCVCHRPLFYFETHYSLARLH
ncbi:hypothetical protein BayCH28_22240 [Mycolicibacterium sp. CH28]|uniref:hypothetical protein n=1 Tax=Mycolicibacterium sp. CH28 TaxID=2512237 RepID=UPI001081C0FD|nr:hypothetical protein [Mycolicibacterium sp. CH28]TGD85124.1 hypothetical protein BayCH28_22240 [Mycolicibacterium sp. CH28]